MLSLISFFNRIPFSEPAAKVLMLCENNEISGFISPVIISNVYYLLRKTASHDVVIEKLQELLQIVDVVVMDRQVISDSLDSRFSDFEDALQNFSTIRNGRINFILTRNLSDFRRSQLAVMTPEHYLKERAYSE